MKKLFITAVSLVFAFTVSAQINMIDSTVQVIGYWSKAEKQTYKASLEKYKVSGTDTLERQMTNYVIEITVKDSTEKTYLLEWHFKNFKCNAKDESVRRMACIAEGMKVLIETDELGSINEVKNWKEVGEHLDRASKSIYKDIKTDDSSLSLMAELKNMYNSKEAVEANAIKDALQFHSFHGGAYQIGEELTGQIPLYNNFGGEPFMADLLVSLDEVNDVDDDYIIRSTQTIDPKALTDATYDFLKKSKTMGKEIPARKNFPTINNEISVSSLIHGSSGWVIYTVETKVFGAEGDTRVEERIIDLQ